VEVRARMKYIYKITYPNDKIYVGQDVTESFMTYFGSGNKDYINSDFTKEQFQSFSVKKEILWSAETIAPHELMEMENEFIEKLGANDPEKGYNLYPKFAK
jgi:hypothetical protein